MNTIIDGGIIHNKGGTQAHGSIAKTVLANKGDVSSLRTNATLQYDEWVHVDNELLRSYRDNLVGVAHLKERNLVYDLGGKGMNFSTIRSQSMSNAGNAHLTMTGLSRGESDLPNFSTNYFPLPLIVSDWFIDVRHLTESHNNGTDLDTTMIEQAGEEIAQFQENMLFNGSNQYSFGGGTLWGYTDHPNRHQGVLTGAWSDSGVTGKNIVDDIISMIDDLVQDKQPGPYAIYIPSKYQSKLNEDYTTNYSKNILMKIKELGYPIDIIEVSDKLADDNVLVVQLSRKTIRMVTGLPLTNIEWSEQGGFVMKWKAITIDVPQIRSDHEGRCGIAHYVAPST